MLTISKAAVQMPDSSFALLPSPRAPPLSPGLYVIATPIGNLGDITYRAADMLARASVVACEDTRQTAKLLRHLGLKVPLVAYHDHNAEQMRPQLLARAATEAVALVSDAGTPLISDPGFKLVREARALGLAVTTAPGACSVIAALTLAGLPTDTFYFGGFLPTKVAARKVAVAALATIPATLVLFESAPRLVALLKALADGLGDREARVAREISKLYEEVCGGRLTELAAQYMHVPARGEIVVVIGPPESDHKAESLDVDALLDNALKQMSLKAAVAEVTAATGLPRKQIYARALSLTA